MYRSILQPKITNKETKKKKKRNMPINYFSLIKN